MARAFIARHGSSLPRYLQFLGVVVLLYSLLPRGLVCVCGQSTSGEAALNATTKPPSKHHDEEEGVRVASFEWKKLSDYVIVLLFILLVILLKMAYNHLPALAAYVPESCILIGVGIIFGSILRYGFPDRMSNYKLTPDMFFLIYLPPIVLEASYSLYNRNFGENLGTILLFAVLGTIFNFLIIGFSLYGVNIAGAMGPGEFNIPVKECLLFSALIVAVDPVAVLAIFQDIGVEQNLYYLVFGESLLNDAVTVVLYGIMTAFVAQKHVTMQEIGLGVASFFTVSLGGLIVGLIIGILCCFITRGTKHTRLLEPIVLLAMAYFAYILGDLFGWSGIISMIGCGIIQAAYAFHNISRKSIIVVKRGAKMISSISEAVIFLFLGSEVMTETLIWHTGFHLWALAFCLVSRALVILVMCAVINWFRVDLNKISLTEQFVLIYGGLRGAVAFALAVLIDEKKMGENGKDERNLFITATLFIILFTVVPMGLTMKPLVKLLHIRMNDAKHLSILQVTTDNVVENCMCAVECITGEKGRNSVRRWFDRINERYIRVILQNNPETREDKLLQVYEKVSLALHYASIHPDRCDHYLDKISHNFRLAGSGASSSDLLNQSQTSLTCDDVSMSSANRQEDDDDNDHVNRYRRRRSTVLQVDPGVATTGVDLAAALRYQRRRRTEYTAPPELEFEMRFREMVQSKKTAARRTSRAFQSTANNSALAELAKRHVPIVEAPIEDDEENSEDWEPKRRSQRSRSTGAMVKFNLDDEGVGGGRINAGYERGGEKDKEEVTQL